MLRERWEYPSADLLRYRSGSYPYDEDWGWILPVRGTRWWASPEKPENWQYKLLVYLAAQHHKLSIVIDLQSMPWNEPRYWVAMMQPYAQKVGYSPKKYAHEFLQEFREPNPATDLRDWHIHVDHTSTVEEILTNLVLCARKQGFPVSPEDYDTVWLWIYTTLEKSRLRGIDDLRALDKEVFAALEKRFDLPIVRASLPAFIRATASGIARSQRRKSSCLPLTETPYFVDDVLGQLASEATVESWVPSRDTLYDWIQAGKVPVVRETFGRKLLDENGLQSVRKLVKDKNQRRALVEYQINELGKPRRAADKFIQDHEKRGESLKDIAKALLSQQRGSDT